MKAILTFHSIDPSGSVLSYTPGMFAELITSLRESRIPIVGLRDLLDNDVKRAVAITFDDGMQSVYKHALPVLREFGAPAHLFLTTGPIDKPGTWPGENSIGPNFQMLTWKEIEKLHEAGIAIEGHTDSHPDMRTLSVSQMSEDCEIADGLIEDRLGRRPEFFAYPFGYHSAEARNFANHRYLASVTTELGEFGESYDNAAIPRLDSYYLRSGWLVRNFMSAPVRRYFKLRSALRNLRGTQCPADAP